MKRFTLFTALLFFVGLTYSQNLPKGTLVGVHNITVTLKPGATMQQFTDFFINKYKPEAGKLFPEWQWYLTKSVRGENNNSMGWIFVIKTEKDRDKYYNPDGSMTELGNKAFEKLKPIFDEWEKIGTWTSKYTDWVIQ